MTKTILLFENLHFPEKSKIFLFLEKIVSLDRKKTPGIAHNPIGTNTFTTKTKQFFKIFPKIDFDVCAGFLYFCLNFVDANFQKIQKGIGNLFLFKLC